MTVRLGADATGSDNVPAGVTFLGRYLSDFPSKNLTPGEAQRLTAAGLDIVSNWENDTNDWAGGYAQGIAYATRAWQQHKACGGLDGRPVYFSVDMDADPSNATLHQYFAGLGHGMTPGQIGVYGSTAVCNALKAAGLAAWTWRTMSTGWSGGVGLPSMFNIEQTGYLNSSYDRDASITDDFGQWRVGGAPLPPPLPDVLRVSLSIAQMCAHNDPALPQGDTTNFADVYPIQRALESQGLLSAGNPYWGRGAFGSMTVAAYARWQTSLGYRGSDADGIPGMASLVALGNRSGIFTVIA